MSKMGKNNKSFQNKSRSKKWNIRKDTSIFHPVFFAIYPVLFLFSNNVFFVDYTELILPLILTVSVSVGLFLFLKIFLKNWKKSALIISLGLVLFFSYGHIYNIVDDYSFESLYFRHIYLITIYLGIFSIGSYFIVKSKKELENITTIANVVSLSLIIISGITIGSNLVDEGFGISKSIKSENLESVTTGNNQSYPSINVKPDIYYIILDGYTNEIILNEFFSFDNSEFLNFLREKGFFVVPNGHSNYSQTFQSINSALNMKYVNYLAEELGKDSRANHKAFQMIDRNKVMSIAKSEGYFIVNFASNDAKTGNIEVADIAICEEANPFVKSQFMIMLIRTSALSPVYVELFDSHIRERTYCVLSELPNLEERFNDQKPLFVFAHLLVPHPPYRFGPNGEEITPNELELGQSGWDEKKGYIDQIMYINKEISKIVSNIIEKSEVQPVIIIQGDHGSFHILDAKNPTKDGIRERMSILNAYYLPDINDDGEDNTYNNITPVNTFRLVFNKYLNTSFDLLDDHVFYSSYQRPYDFMNVTDMVR